MATLIIDVTPELESRLCEEASKRGLAAPEYAQSLLAEKLLEPGGIPHQPDTLAVEERARRVQAARGAFAHVPWSSDDRAREKQAEIELEEQRWKQRHP
jgi:hypothetical protein